MELSRTLSVAALALLVLAGCQRDQWDDCITSTGPMHAEERAPGAFNAIDLNDRIDLVLEERAPGSVAVEAGENLIAQVATEVSDGVLRISNRNRCQWVRSFKPRITVRVPVRDLCKVTVRGTGQVSCADTVRCGYFHLEQWDAEGDCRLLLNVGRVDIGLHSGAGATWASGLCNEAYLYSGIMGPIDASRLRAGAVYVNNSSVADIRCWPQNELNARVGSVGDVYYRGDPPILQSTIVGAGRLIKAD